MEKKCSKCGNLKDIREFSCTKKNEDGSCKYYNSWCNSCRTINNRQRLGQQERVKPYIATKDGGKECLKCFIVKPLTEFYPSKKGRQGRSAYCRDCQPRVDKEKASEYTRQYRERNKLRWRSLHRIHQYNRRALVKATDDGTVTDSVLEGIYEKEMCFWCGEYINPSDRTLEHIKELSQGGVHSIHNITMACRSCNSRRRNRNNDYQR